MSIKKNGIFISFLGSRGSGKTTIADFVYNRLEKRGLSCLRQHPGFKRRPFLQGIITAVSLWRFFDLETIIFFGFRGRKRRWWPSLYRLYLPLAFAHDLHYLANRNKDVLIYDSNILRGIISAVASGAMKSREVEDLYKKRVLSKVNNVILVVVDTDPAESVKRWVARDKVVLSEATRKIAVEERITLAHDINVVVDILSKLPHVSVIHLNGDIAPEENADRVMGSIGN